MGISEKAKTMMKIIMIIMSFTIAIQASKIVEIQVKTSNELNADMTFGHLDLVICGEPECCLIENLDSKHDDFQLGSSDSFTNQDLQGCKNFSLPEDILKSLLIAHRGLDGWLGEYILVLLDSGLFYKCEIPGWLHNADDYQLQCSTGNYFG